MQDMSDLVSQDAITMGNDTAVIDPEKCIGCGECLAVCQFDAVKIAWDEDTANLQKRSQNIVWPF